MSATAVRPPRAEGVAQPRKMQCFESKEAVLDTSERAGSTEDELVSPMLLKAEIPCSADHAARISKHRAKVDAVVQGRDDRLVVVIGPCSIHDTDAAKEYAYALFKLANELENDLVVVMRTYFEKPRTTVGWKGLINDPGLDNTFDVNTGLRKARQLLVDITEIGLPCSIEFLDNISPRFMADMITWGAIGARTTESQVHREMASGLPCAIGFKNATNGSLKVAADAMQAAQSTHSFIGVNGAGITSIIHTPGNDACHVILRGSDTGPNFAADSVRKTEAELIKHKMPVRIMIDCSHGNSEKKHKNQLKVAASISEQVAVGDTTIMGVMIESNINEGNQKLVPGQPLAYGVSITDACIDLGDTVNVLRQLAIAVQKRRFANAAN